MSKIFDLYPTKYEIKFWSEFDNAIVIERGLIYAESYADFMAMIEDFYGSDNIASIEIAQLEAGPILINKEQYEQLDQSSDISNKEKEYYAYAVEDEDDF